jgi:hypothetical protein
MNDRIAILIAVALGLLIAPVVVMLSMYSTWSIVAMLGASALVGALLSRRARGAIRRAALGGMVVALAAFAVTGIVYTRSPLGGFAIAASTWWWFALAAVAGAGGAAIAVGRRRTGVIAITAVVLLFVAGWIVAAARASDTLVASDPCQRHGGMSAECQLYVNCPLMAERRRVGTFERVTVFDVAGAHARCEYITWGGITVGTVEVDHGGSLWYAGP